MSTTRSFSLSETRALMNRRLTTFSTTVRLVDSLRKTKMKWKALTSYRKDTGREVFSDDDLWDIDPADYFSFPVNPPPPPPLPLDLHVYPRYAQFIAEGGASKHVLTNKGTERIVWKIRCSNNALFKVCPVFAFLDSGQSADMHIIRLDGPTRKDKLVIMYKVAKAEEVDPKKSIKNEGIACKLILPLLIVEPVAFYSSSRQEP